MKSTRRSSFIGIHLLVAIFLFMGVQAPAFSSIVTSDELAAGARAEQQRSELASMFDREDVRKELIKRGVDPNMAKERVAGLTDAEVAKLTQDIDNLPAGEGVLGLIVVLLVILVLTEILGYTDVSNKI